jgi:hypothetical protein
MRDGARITRVAPAATISVLMATDGPRAGSVRAKLIVNSILAISFVAISAPQATRMPVHEWLSLAFMGILALHILFSWAWIVGVTRRFLASVRGEFRFNYLLDAASYAAMIVATISGLVISEAALPALGFPRPSDRFWSVIHDLSSEALLVLIGVHLAMHWDWVVAASKRFLAGTLGTATGERRGLGVWMRPLATLAVVSLVLSAATLAMSALPQAERLRAARGGGGGAQEKGGKKARAASSTDTPLAVDTGATIPPAAVASQPAPPSDGATAVDRAKGEKGERGAKKAKGAKGAKAARSRPAGGGGGGQLGWRQRYLRPGVKIAGFMGAPFLLTLLIMSAVRRSRRTSAPSTGDPLEQRAE